MLLLPALAVQCGVNRPVMYAEVVCELPEALTVCAERAHFADPLLVEYYASPVSTLYGRRRPPAIVRRVGARIVDTIKRMASGAWGHIRNEALEITPPRADRDAARAISAVIPCAHIVAARHHACPSSVERVLPQAVHDVLFLRSLEGHRVAILLNTFVVLVAPSLASGWLPTLRDRAGYRNENRAAPIPRGNDDQRIAVSARAREMHVAPTPAPRCFLAACNRAEHE